MNFKDPNRPMAMGRLGTGDVKTGLFQLRSDEDEDEDEDEHNVDDLLVLLPLISSSLILSLFRLSFTS